MLYIRLEKGSVVWGYPGKSWSVSPHLAEKLLLQGAAELSEDLPQPPIKWKLAKRTPCGKRKWAEHYEQAKDPKIRNIQKQSKELHSNEIVNCKDNIHIHNYTYIIYIYSFLWPAWSKLWPCPPSSQQTRIGSKNDGLLGFCSCRIK